jgi:hypothetical protein
MEEQVGRAMNEPTYPRAKANFPTPPATDPVFGPVGSLAHFSIIGANLMPDCSRWTITHFQGLTDRRAAVIALAIRLYRFDHGGNWPRDLNELTPAYLPAIPTDPFSPTDSPFRYKPDAAGGPIIYSVGEDGVDDGGSEQLIHRSSFSTRPAGIWDRKDAVYHLTLLPAATQPADSP